MFIVYYSQCLGWTFISTVFCPPLFLHIMWTLSILYEMLMCAGNKLNWIELHWIDSYTLLTDDILSMLPQTVKKNCLTVQIPLMSLRWIHCMRTWYRLLYLPILQHLQMYVMERGVKRIAVHDGLSTLMNCTRAPENVSCYGVIRESHDAVRYLTWCNSLELDSNMPFALLNKGKTICVGNL